MSSVPSHSDRLIDSAAGRRLEYFTLGWNLLEAVIAVAAGLHAASIALIGFGIDSLIESLSGAVLLWRLWVPEHDEARERIALRLVGLSLFLLALYVGFDAIRTLITGDAPSESLVGIGLAAVSLIVMPILARAKRRVAARLQSAALVADSRQTDICAYLSGILLAGLALNALFDWWWADPIAALVMLPIIAKEGWEAWQGETCSDCC